MNDLVRNDYSSYTKLSSNMMKNLTQEPLSSGGLVNPIEDRESRFSPRRSRHAGIFRRKDRLALRAGHCSRNQVGFPTAVAFPQIGENILWLRHTVPVQKE